MVCVVAGGTGADTLQARVALQRRAWQRRMALRKRTADAKIERVLHASAVAWLRHEGQDVVHIARALNTSDLVVGCAYYARMCV